MNEMQGVPPADLLGAKHDDPDPTGPLVSVEPHDQSGRVQPCEHVYDDDLLIGQQSRPGDLCRECLEPKPESAPARLPS